MRGRSVIGEGMGDKKLNDLQRETSSLGIPMLEFKQDWPIEGHDNADSWYLFANDLHDVLQGIKDRWTFVDLQAVRIKLANIEPLLRLIDTYATANPPQTDLIRSTSQRALRELTG